MRQVAMHIEGMSCGHCLNAVNQALAAVPGVTIRSVRIGRADVEVADDGPRSDDLVAAVEAAAYNVAHVEGAA